MQRALQTPLKITPRTLELEILDNALSMWFMCERQPTSKKSLNPTSKYWKIKIYLCFENRIKSVRNTHVHVVFEICFMDLYLNQRFQNGPIPNSIRFDSLSSKRKPILRSL